MERHLPPSNNWWHWPAIIGLIVLLGLWAAAIAFPPADNNFTKKRQPLSTAEVDRENAFCHDKGLTAVHIPFDGPPEKIWCLMEVPR
jgi:hypothetical protein